MVDKQSWKIKQPGKPSNHKDDMKRFNPKHEL
jgi:hypothetical protein